MKTIAIVSSIMGVTFCSIFLGAASFLGFWQLGSYVVYEGQLAYSADRQEIVLRSSSSCETLDLSFRYDNEDELIVDDFGEVKVRGYYISSLNVLRVEEIMEVENLVVL